jgi:hypothetical protein
MTKATENIIRSACAMDATVDADTTERVVALLKGAADAQGRPFADEPLTPGEVAKMLKCTTRTVARYGETGLIRRIGNRKDGTQTRYSRRSVVAFLNGEAAA